MEQLTLAAASPMEVSRWMVPAIYLVSALFLISREVSLVSSDDTKWFISKLSISCKEPPRKNQLFSLLTLSSSVMNHHHVKMEPLDMITVVSVRFFGPVCCCVYLCQCVYQYVWLDKTLTQLLSKYHIKFFVWLSLLRPSGLTPPKNLSLFCHISLSLTLTLSEDLRWHVYLFPHLQFDDRLRLIKS